MSVRITQQRLSVLEPIAQTSDLRVSQHILQVLVTDDLTPEVNLAALDNVAFTEAGSCELLEAPEVATDTLLFNESAVINNVFNVSAASSLLFTDGIGLQLNGAFCFSAGDTCAFDDLASDRPVLDCFAVDTISITDIAFESNVPVIQISAEDYSPYTESNTFGFVICAEAEDDLSVLVFDFPTDPFDTDPTIGTDQPISFGPVRVSGIVESATSFCPQNDGQQDNLRFNEGSNCYIIRGDAQDISAADTVTISDSAAEGVCADGVETLDLSEVASCETACPSREQVTFNELATIAIEQNLIEEDIVDFTENAFLQICNDSGLNVKIAESYDYPDASGVVDGIQLISPATGAVADELVLPSPNFGNNYQLTVTRVNNESRGGTLILYTDPECWPTTETLQFSISNMKGDVAKGLLQWFETHLGEQIRLVDYEGRAWVGVIITPDDPIVEDRRNRWTGSFEFEGELVDV